MGVTKTVLKKIIVSWILIEISLRLFLFAYAQTPVFQPEKFIYRYYPNLHTAENYQYKKPKSNILMLGGSTLYADTLRFNYNNTSYALHFCNLAEQLKNNTRMNICCLAYPANTIIDCFYEYRFLQKEKFDYLLLYNGINDTRANNIPYEHFSEQYRHIEFYDDLAIYERHPEIRVTTIPFITDWVVHLALKTLTNKKYLPKENLHHLKTTEGINNYLRFGGDIKTASVFKKNLEEIKLLADKRGQKLILCTLAWYQPDNYSYENFINKKLDYAQSLFATELYGLPENVIKGINAHNAEVRKFTAQHPDVIFLDAENIIPKNGKYFDDICHFSDEGCVLFSNSVLSAISTGATH